MHRSPRPRGLYLITPDTGDTPALLSRVRVALAGGPTWLQYRNKGSSPALRREQAEALLRLCRGYRVPLIVNDDTALAAAIGADGVHLGADDGEVRAAREMLGTDALIGASCYDDALRAERAVSEGASYVAFGAFFRSPTKPAAPRAALHLLARSATDDVPRVAIGGITPDNAPQVVAAGADLVAVISGVFDAPDPAAAVRAYRRAFDSASGNATA